MGELSHVLGQFLAREKQFFVLFCFARVCNVVQEGKQEPASQKQVKAEMHLGRLKEIARKAQEHLASGQLGNLEVSKQEEAVS